MPNSTIEIAGKTVWDFGPATPAIRILNPAGAEVFKIDSSGGIVTSSLFEDGTAALPGAAFENEPSSGFYRVSAGVVGVSILGVQVANFYASGIDVSIAATTLKIIANTAVAFTVSNGTTTMIGVDTRNTVSTQAITLRPSPPTIAAVSGSTFSVLSIPTFTLTLTGSTLVTALNGIAANFAAPTITDASAETVTTASTVYISGAPITAGSITQTNSYALHVAGGASLFAGLVTVNSTSSAAIAVGANGATNPVLLVDASVASQRDGVSIQGQATTAGAYVQAISNGATSTLILDGKSTGGIQLGGLAVGSTTTVFVDGANGFRVARAAASPAFKVVGGIASSVTGLQLTPAAAGGGVALAVIGGNAAESLTVDAEGAGTITLGGTSTGAVIISRATSIATGLAVGATYSSGNGVFVQNASTNNAISTASQGAASTTLYIGNTAITVVSDERAKHDLRVWDADAVSVIGNLPVYEFEQDRDRPLGDVSHYIGLTAQSVFRHAPWAVNTQGGRDCEDCLHGRACDVHPLWQVNYGLLTGLAFKAIQELDARLAAVEAR